MEQPLHNKDSSRKIFFENESELNRGNSRISESIPPPEQKYLSTSNIEPVNFSFHYFQYSVKPLAERTDWVRTCRTEKEYKVRLNDQI